MIEINYLQSLENKTDKLKYLGEWIEPNRFDNETKKGRTTKVELVYRLVQNICNKRVISYKVDKRLLSSHKHSQFSEWSMLNKKGGVQELEKKETKSSD